MKKRFLSIALVLCMLLMLMPTAMATDTSTDDTEPSEKAVASVTLGETTTTYDTLQKAVDEAQTGSTITLLEDVEDGTGVIVQGTDNRTLTIDFAGHTYTVSQEPFAGSTGTQNQCFQLLKGSTITMKNGTIVANNSGIRMMIQNYSNLTLVDMTLDATQGANNVGYVLSNNNGNTVITGETNITAKETGCAFDAYSWPNGGYTDGVTVTLDENMTGTITGNIECTEDNKDDDNKKQSYIVIQSGTIDGNVTGASKGSIEITGGEVTGNVTNSSTGTINISDATVGGKVENTSSGQVIVTSSTVGEVDENVIVVSSTVGEDENVTQGTKDAVAMIGTTTYATLDAAIEAAKDNDVIELLADIEVDASNVQHDSGAITIGKKITLEGNGKTIKAIWGPNPNKTGVTLLLLTSEVTVQNLTVDGNNVIRHGVQAYGETANVTLENVTIKNSAWYGLVVNSGASVAATDLNTTGNQWGVNVDSKSVEATTFTMESGTIAEEASVVMESTGGTSKTNISDGTFQNVIVQGTGSKAETTISGGTFNGITVADGVTAENVKFTITGGTFATEIPDGYAPDGYAVSIDKDGNYVVGEVKGSVSSVMVVDGDDGVTPVSAPVAGQKLLANIKLSDGTTIGGYPVDPNATYTWYYEDAPDNELGHEPYYTVTSDNLKRTLAVRVEVKGYTGFKTWTAWSDVATRGSVKTVEVVDGDDGVTPVTTPVVGQKLSANIELSDGTTVGTYPVNEDATYKWHYIDSDAVLGTEPVYTVTEDNLGKTICVDVTVRNYDGSATWEAKETVAWKGTVEKVEVVDGNDGVTPVTIPVVGQKLSANIILDDGTTVGTYPVNEDATYNWYYKESPDTSLGEDPVYTVTEDNLGKTICVDVKIENYDGSATWTANGVVTETIAVESVTLDKEKVSLEAGDTTTLTATVKPDNATDKTVAWSSSDEKVATVDKDGVVTAVAEGTATITATAGDKTATCEVTVTKAEEPVEVTSITLNKTATTLIKGESETLTATVKPDNATDKTITWSSSDETIATVEGGKIEAKGYGIVTITARSGDQYATCEVSVICDDETCKFYTDVNEDAWYHAAVDYVTEYKVMQGIGNKEFAPESGLTRAQLVQILYNMEGKPTYTVEDKFSDVQEKEDGQDVWYYDAVMWAASEGIVTGYEDKEFKPDREVTRQEMVTIIHRYAVDYKQELDGEVTEDLDQFEDSDSEGVWDKDSFAWAVQNGIVNGKDGNLAPADNARRAEAAKIMMVYCVLTGYTVD